jgi:hypothetical protein
MSPSRLACGEGGDQRERLHHRFARETASDKEQPRPTVVVGPIFEFDSRMGDMLDEVHDHRARDIRRAPPAFWPSGMRWKLASSPSQEIFL